MTKQESNLILFVVSTLFLVSNIMFAIQTADPDIHWDASNYYNGYLALKNLNYTETYSMMTRPGEIYLQSIYAFLSQIITLKTATQIIIINSIIFSLSYLIAIFVFIFHGSDLIDKKLTTFTLFILVSQAGLPLQIARQAIAFPFLVVTICVLVPVITKKYSVFIAPFFALISHRFSIMVAILLSLIKNWKVIIILLIVIYGISTLIIYENYYNISNVSMHTNHMRYGNATSFSNPYHILILFLTLLSLILYRIRLVDISLLLILIFLMNFYPNSMFRRVFLGYDFFFIPYVLGCMLSSSAPRGRYSTSLLQLSIVGLLFAKTVVINVI